MTEFRQITSTEWAKQKPKALALFRAYHDGHITKRTFDHVRKLRARHLEQTGNVVWSAWSNGRLVGVLVMEKYGARTAAAVVHRAYRGQGINKELLMSAARFLGKFYGEIASDNLPSLRSAFAAGLVAYDAFVRRGKVTLRLQNGFSIDQR